MLKKIETMLEKKTTHSATVNVNFILKYFFLPMFLFKKIYFYNISLVHLGIIILLINCPTEVINILICFVFVSFYCISFHFILE